MNDRPSISVAMATYNGEKYIRQQIESILTQLAATDELIISDNGSKDQTLEILQDALDQDPRIRLIHCAKPGVIANFNNALAHCNNDIIFLSDQDDIWQSNKVAVMLNNFMTHPNIDLIMSDITVVDDHLNPVIPSFFAYRGTKLGVVKNIIKNTYIGCAMAFRKSFVRPLLPIPDNVPMHDMWLGILANKHHAAMLIPDKLVLYRRHNNTVTTVENHSSFGEKIKWRFDIIRTVFFR
ncbi:glycosyltransferase family 2 protein [Lapidilactobacillus luobeiensis]|uniref:glycosyltransferase family 2 protein n=1 Tax=Lapidilactobacillus luobeiensis TaxID=2950371 RepID=UPI0021C3F3FC|nr:glycosyltransferase family 2 protein [Lapidilactobacillus luobeiensis]